MEKAEKLLKRLPLLEIVQLREQWFLHYHGEIGNKMSAKLLRLAIAYRVQELENDVTARCDAIRKKAAEMPRMRGESGHGYAQRIAPGTKLLREYKGTMHEVLAIENGRFVHEGQVYSSLTAVARKIAGRTVSGMVFFGFWHRRRPVGDG
ncbi:MAG: DUF2924 domain-containing protein [Aestuariivirga sp.]|nr:DUF2924 domain-containing protein [Aestuariivirga sp.]